MGDYYRGDPGFFSFLGKVAKTAVGFIPGIGGTVSKAIEKVGARAPILRKVGGAIVKHPVLSAAGAAGVAGAGVGAMGARMGGSAAAAGKAHHGVRMIGGGRHRRMRVTNPKALRRALRRAYGFERLAMKTIHLLHPKKHVRFGGFKKRRRAK